MRRITDLSHPIETEMVTYPGLPGPQIGTFTTREQSRQHYAPGTEFSIGQITMVGNTGTYVDSPFHRFPDGADLAALPLERLADIPAIRISNPQDRRAINAADLRPYHVAGKAVLIHTGWDRHWRTTQYLSGHPFVTAEAAEWLATAGASLVGIDSVNIDDAEDLTRPAHTILLRAGVPICEHLTRLGEVPAEGSRFTAVPAPVRGLASFPVRAYAVY